MPKYRLLTDEEFKHLEKEFIDFLVLNGITSEDWVNIKKENIEDTARILEAFSDVIMEGALRKTQFLERVDTHRIASIHFQESQMVMAAMEAPLGSIADFTNPEFIKEATLNPPSYLKAFTTTEKYSSTREAELFQFTERGWLVSDGNLYKTLVIAATK